MKYKWSKLTDGWVRNGGRLCKQVTELVAFYSDDQGDAYWDYTPEGRAPERTLELLIEAVAQRKQCEVPEPRFKFGDWVRTPLGSRHRVVDVRRGGVCYTLFLDGMSLYTYDESELTPCDPPDGADE